MTNVKELQSRVDRQQLLKCTCTIYIDLVPVYIQVLKCLILLECLGDSLSTRDSEFALAQVDDLDRFVTLEGGSENLDALLQDLISAEVEDADV